MNDSLRLFAEAALNKIGFARASDRELANLRRGEEDERPDIQRAFESVIGNGVSAGEQLLRAIPSPSGLRLQGNAPGELKPEAGEIDAELVRHFDHWAQLPIVIDARRRRNLAVHAHYVKRPFRPELTWLLEPVKIAGKPSPYTGPLDVHTYSTAYVATLSELERIARVIVDRPPDRISTASTDHQAAPQESG